MYLHFSFQRVRFSTSLQAVSMVLFRKIFVFFHFLVLFFDFLLKTFETGFFHGPQKNFLIVYVSPFYRFIRIRECFSMSFSLFFQFFSLMDLFNFTSIQRRRLHSDSRWLSDECAYTVARILNTHVSLGMVAKKFRSSINMNCQNLIFCKSFFLSVITGTQFFILNHLITVSLLL